jgi:hypothetical protein
MQQRDLAGLLAHVVAMGIGAFQATTTASETER